MTRRVVGMPPFARDINSGALVFTPPEQDRHAALEERVEKLEALAVFLMGKVASLEAMTDELHGN